MILLRCSTWPSHRSLQRLSRVHWRWSCRWRGRSWWHCCGWKYKILCFRGTFIVPSFDEIWPQAGKERPGDARRKRMGMDYILEVRRTVLTPQSWHQFVIFRPCSTMDLVTCHSQITLLHVVVWALRSTSTTILSSVMLMRLLMIWERRKLLLIIQNWLRRCLRETHRLDKLGWTNFQKDFIFQKHKEHQVNPIAAQKLKSANFDPKRSAVMMAINAQ